MSSNPDNPTSRPPEASPPDDAVDTTRRTWLAHERTYLAWWRTGLTSFAVGLGAGRVVPALTKSGRVPYALVGAGFAVLGLFFVGYALYRQREVARALERGEFLRPDNRVLVGLTLSAVVLGLGVVLLVATET